MANDCLSKLTIIDLLEIKSKDMPCIKKAIESANLSEDNKKK